jgi:hypothetical protein
MGRIQGLGGFILVAILVLGCDRKNLASHLASLEANGGLRADYYQFASTADTYLFQRKLVTRVDRGINFNFNSQSPAPGVARDNYAIRWYGDLVPPKSGRYMLCTCSDDGVRLYFNGENRIDRWQSQASRFWGTEIVVEANEKYPIRLEYYNGGGGSMAKLFWAENPNGLPWEQVCRNVNPSPDPMNPVPMEDCDSNDTLNPELSIISAAYLQPGVNEADEVLSACSAAAAAPAMNLSSIPDPASLNTQKARRLYQRLAGIDLPIFDPRIANVKALLDQGNPRAAARVVTSHPSFYDKTVRSFAARISTRSERPDVALNDFIATIIGVTRDGVDARRLLTGTFLYRANPKLFWGDASVYSATALMTSNQHYDALDTMKAPLACALDRLDPLNLIQIPDHMQQKLIVPNPATERANPDPAGLLTSRAFAEAHIIAGTNRRPVQKAFEYFACAPIDSWRDAEISDQYVGRDVERFPNGPQSFNEFLSNCKSCHGPMDSMRGAFAQYHFENGYIKFAPFFIERNRPENVTLAAETESRMKLTASCQEGNTACNPNTNPRLPVHWKLNHNVNYAQGSFVRDNSFNNLLTTPRQMLRFGWSGSTSGNGVREFGRMIANSRAFPVCMAKRAFSEVCKDNPSRADFPPEMSQWLEQVGESFATGGYNLKDLFEAVAVNCMD